MGTGRDGTGHRTGVAVTEQTRSSQQPSGNEQGEQAPIIAAKIAFKGTVITASTTLGAAIIAAVVAVILAVVSGSPPGARSPDAKPTQPVPSVPASSLSTPPPSPSVAPSSTATTLPSPIQDPDDTGAVQSNFDNVATDSTTISVDAMLPQQHNDFGVYLHRTSGWVKRCPSSNTAGDTGGILRNFGCTSEIVGTYLDSTAQIQVAVWVIPLPDAAAATGAFNAFDQAGAAGWGIVCPVTSVGSRICDKQWRSASLYARIAACHRYLMRAVALYIDLRSDASALPTLTLAATAANRSIGVHNIPGTQC